MASKKKRKILVVDDSPTLLKKMELILLRAGYLVATAVNGVDGNKKAYKENPDLIVSDIIMPEMDGFHFCRLIKNDGLRQHIPVILLTTLSSGEDKEKGIAAGADAYIVKDSYDHANLLEIIKRLI